MTRSISSGLKAHYALGTTTIAQCWKATLRDGTIVAATTYTEDLVFGGITYVSTAAYNPSDMESQADLSPDNLDVDGFLRAPGITVQDIHDGRWDYANIELFEVNYKDLTQGRNLLRKGTLGRVKAGLSIFTAELRGLMQYYSRKIVTLTTKDCQADFGDARCKIDKMQWAVLGSVDSVTGNKVIHDATRTEATDWFTGGVLTFTSGRNNGLSFEITSYEPGIITLFEQPPNLITAADTPLPTVPAGSSSDPSLQTADTYHLDRGCMKRFYEDCIGQYNNSVNFRGFPHLPGVGVFGSFWTQMTPASVPGAYPTSPPPPPPPAPAPGPAPTPAPPGSTTPFGPQIAYLTGYGAAPAPAPVTVDSSGSTTLTTLLAGTGPNITVPAGIYMIGSPVAIPSGKILTAATGDGVTLKASNGYTGNMIEMIGTTGAGVRNLTIDGNQPNRSSQEGLTTAVAIKISGGSGNIVENNTIQYTPSFAVWVFNSPSLSVKTNQFTECWHPIKIDGNNVANTGNVEANQMTNTSAYRSIQHLEAVNTKSLTVKANRFAGIGLLPPTSHGFEGTWGNSIYIFNSDGYLVENNTVGANYWSAIVSGQNGTNATIRYNSFQHGLGQPYAHQSSWIEQVGADTVSFVSNQLVGGIDVGDTGGDHLTINYNHITVPPGGIGINCNFDFLHGSVSYNTIKQETDAHTDKGIYLWDKSSPGITIDVKNNRIEGFSEGVAINNPGGTGTVYGLTVTNNTYVSCTTNVSIGGGLTVDGSCTIQTTSASPTGTAGTSYPFGSRLTAYASGVAMPSDSTANMDAFIQQQYNTWVANLLKKTDTGLGLIPAGGHWVQFSDATMATVSEGMGYGMLITVLMAGYDAAAQTKFDGLLATVRAFPSGNYGGALNMTQLMSWRVNASGADAGGAWPALDGDLDIALALLMADAQWGSAGTWNYLSIALAMIPQIKSYAFNAAGVIVETSGAMHEGRTSDYMFNHFRAFKRATGDTFWDNAVTQQKRIINYMQTNYAPSTGLIPDWVGGADTATPFLTTSVNDGGNPHENGYWYNACRDPWRIGTDYVLTGDSELKTILTRMETFFSSTTGGTVTNIINGYALDGTGLVAPNIYWIASEFYNPMMVGAMCDTRFQSWIDSLWTFSKAHPEHGYYGTEIQLLCAIVASGNWWTP
jgi:uncharacterized phage protein (TIGR02218 family)